VESKPFLGTVSSFHEAYPEVKTLRFVGKEQGDLASGHDQRKLNYTESTLPSTIPCGNPHCQQGGYDFNTTLMSLTATKATSYEIDWSCNGHEGTPKGRRIGDPCMNSIAGKHYRRSSQCSEPCRRVPNLSGHRPSNE